MKTEIAEAVSFLKSLVKLKDKVDQEKMDVFAERLAVALQEKFEGHWFPENPNKGQAYRCIRVNALYKHDPELMRACRESGVNYGDLGLPWEITLWVDPGEVSSRYGEDNHHFPVATFSTDQGEMMSDDHTSSSDENPHSSPITVPIWDCSHQVTKGAESHTPRHLTIPNRNCSHQMLNPAAPSWNPKKKLPLWRNPPPTMGACSTRSKA